mgnify:CR=1 FL=1
MTAHRSSWLSVAALLLITLLPVSLLAQGKVDKTLRKADDAYANDQYVSASELYLEVLAQDPDNYHAVYRMGLLQRQFLDYREALRYFRKAAEIDSSRNDTVYLYTGLTYKILDNCRKAEEAFRTFMRFHQTQDELYQRAELEIAGCELITEVLQEKPPYEVEPVSFNSTADDLFPARLNQGQEDEFLAFMSSRVPPGKRGRRNQVTGQPNDREIYYLIRENDSTFAGELRGFNKRINHRRRNDGPATFTGDGLTMYFVSCNTKYNRDGCSIFESKYNPVKKEWSKPVFVEALAGERQVVNSRGKTETAPSDDTQPYITRDGRTLFFVSDRPGGEGGYDLWYSRRVGAGWSEPQNLGPDVNTPFNEQSPFFSDNGDKLYFASTGYPSFGGYDLFEVEGSIESGWGEVKNVGYPVNTTYNDLGGIWTGEGDSIAYFSSDRPGGVGNFDIYYARKKPVELSKLQIAVKGTIRDKQTKEPVAFAVAILFEYQANGTLVPLDTFQTDQTARYEFPLRADREYKVLGNAPEYLANEEEVSTMGIRGDREIVQNIDIELDPIIIDQPIVLNNIYYDFDEFYLRPDALAELQSLLKILRQNPNITIRMGSHTDSNGTVPYNDVLSDNRAKAVVRYLADNNIDPARLSWFGYGESDPLVFPETSDADEQANRRTEFRIRSVDFE